MKVPINAVACIDLDARGRHCWLVQQCGLNPYQPPRTEECLQPEPPSAGLIPDVLDALPPPVRERLLVILLCVGAI